MSLRSFATSFKTALLKSDCILFFFHDFIHVYSPGAGAGAGADNPLGTKFRCQQEHLVTSGICCKFKKNSLKSDLYNFFFMILYMYVAPGQGQTETRGQNLDVNRKALSLYPFGASFKETSLNSDFIHVYSPGAGGLQPPGDKVVISTEMSCQFIHLLQVSKKCL